MVIKIILWGVVLLIYWIVSVGFYWVMTAGDDAEEPKDGKYWYIEAPIALAAVVVLGVVGVVFSIITIPIHFLFIVISNFFIDVRQAFIRP